VRPLGFDLGLVPGLRKKINDAMGDQIEKFLVVPKSEFISISHLYHQLRVKQVNPKSATVNTT
jgi:Ca2+-dependent lipid-binding protein